MTSLVSEYIWRSKQHTISTYHLLTYIIIFISIYLLFYCSIKQSKARKYEREGKKSVANVPKNLLGKKGGCVFFSGNKWTKHEIKDLQEILRNKIKGCRNNYFLIAFDITYIDTSTTIRYNVVIARECSNHLTRDFLATYQPLLGNP